MADSDVFRQKKIKTIKTIKTMAALEGGEGGKLDAGGGG